jgi:hypothetical protein
MTQLSLGDGRFGLLATDCPRGRLAVEQVGPPSPQAKAMSCHRTWGPSGIRSFESRREGFFVYRERLQGLGTQDRVKESAWSQRRRIPEADGPRFREDRARQA